MVISFVSQKRINSDWTWLCATRLEPVAHDTELLASLVEPCRLERLIDVPALAPDGLGKAPIPSLRSATIRVRSKVTGRPL